MLDKISLPSQITALWSDIPPIEQANLPKHPTLTWEGIEGVRNEDAINAIIIHHTASEAPLVNQAKYHINTHGWPGLSYHIIISGGKILQVNDLRLFTYHASANNGYSVAITIHGDLSKREMTEQERKLLYAAILTVKSLLPITRILAHNEVNPTSCPCTSISRIREDIAKLELTLKSQEDPAQQRHKMYIATEQHRYLYNQYAADPSANKWIEPYLLKMYEVTKEYGMFFDK